MSDICMCVYGRSKVVTPEQQGKWVGGWKREEGELIGPASREQEVEIIKRADEADVGLISLA